MPMMRERITEWPYIPGSSIKGVQRESLAAELEKREGNAASVPLKKEEWLNAAFGKADQRDSGGKGIEGNAGALVFSDSRLFAFPVASFYGTLRMSLARLPSGGWPAIWRPQVWLPVRISGSWSKN